MPVVAVNDVRLPAQLLEHLQGGPAKEHEPLPIVIVAVDLLAAEVLVAANQVGGHILDGALEDRGQLVAGACGHRQ